MGGYCHYGKDKAIYRPPLSFRGAKRRGNPFSLCRKCIFVRCIGGADCEASLRTGFAMTGCFYAALSFPLCSSLSSGDPFGASCHCLAAARSRRGSDMPLACHSLPRRRFATLEGAALRGEDSTAPIPKRGHDAKPGLVKAKYMCYNIYSKTVFRENCHE